MKSDELTNADIERLFVRFFEAMGRSDTGTKIWIGVTTFFSLWYLSNKFTTSLLIATFMTITMFTGLAYRWLARTGIVVTGFALLVTLGFPHPSEWRDIAHQTRASIAGPCAVSNS